MKIRKVVGGEVGWGGMGWDGVGWGGVGGVQKEAVK